MLRHLQVPPGSLGRVRLFICTSIFVTAMFYVTAVAHANTITTTSSGSIAVPATGTFGVASQYPSSINVNAPGGVVADVNVTLNAVSHAFPDDIQVVLQAPSGQTVGLMGSRCGSSDLTSATITFDDAALGPLADAGPCAAGSYDPSGVATSMTAPAPASPYGTTLGSLNGLATGGTWKLWVRDAVGGDIGSIASWTLTINNVAAYIPSSGPASPFPLTKTVSGMSGPITDVNVLVNGFNHTYPDDVDMMLQSPAGKTVMLVSDACGGTDLTSVDWQFDDQAPAQLSDLSGPACSAFAVKPSDFTSGTDTFDPPAPAGPYGATLAALNGDDANGTWKLFIRDDLASFSGSLDEGYSLQITTQPPPPPPPPPPAVTPPVVQKSACDGKSGRGLRRCLARQRCLSKYKAKTGSRLTNKQKRARTKCLRRARTRK